MAGLPAFALLLTTSRALRGKTDAGSSVLVAPRESLTITTPQIAVFNLSGEMTPQGRVMGDAVGFTTLRIELYVPFEAKIVSGDITLDMASSSSGELVLSALWNDAVQTLQVDPSPWAELWREFVLRVHKFAFASALFEDKSGGRIAMRQIDLECEVLNEPLQGRPATGAWKHLLDLLTAAADPESLALCAYLQNKIESNVAGTWQVVSAATGVGVEHLGEIGNGPLDWLAREPDKR